MSERPVIVIGAGGHGRVVVEALQRAGRNVVEVLDRNPEVHGHDVLGVPVIGGDERLEEIDRDTVALANGIGSIADATARRELFDRLSALGFQFATILHPSAVVGSDVELCPGAQIMAGTIIQPTARIGRNAIINTAASIDHDCSIGDHVHVAPGATLSGNVNVGRSSHIGAGATVIQEIRIGENVIIGAGAVVVSDVADGLRVAGVPARELV